jgi:hypothetical protein
MLARGGVSQVEALHERGLEGLEPLDTYRSLLDLPIRMYRVPDPLPRTYVVSGVRVADDDAALSLLDDPAFDPTREVVLSAGDAPSAGRAPAPRPAFAGRSRVALFRPDRVALECEASEDGFAVLLDTFDEGWKVRVDGADARLLRANVAFRAVAVPAGRHRVEMVYRPRPALAGLVATAVTLAAALVARLLRGGGRAPSGP